MAAILFPDHDALRLALASGAVPAAVAQSPAKFGVDAQGRLWIEPAAAALPRALAAALPRFGALVQGTSGVALTSIVASWPLILPLQRSPGAGEAGPSVPVLFDLPNSKMVPAFVADLRRLGVGRVGYRAPGAARQGSDAGSRILLLVERPPYSALLRAIDRIEDGPRAFVCQAPRVWVEHGHSHPLADQITPPGGHVALLTAPRGWEWLHDAPFKTGPDSFSLPRQPPTATEAPLDNLALPVELKLIPSRDNEAPALWIVPEALLGQLQALVEQSDDRLLARLSLAYGSVGAERIAVLRVRSTRSATPVVLFNGALACRPLLRMPNLFVPCGLQLRPLLRRDVLRQWLAADAETLVWLAPVDRGRCVRHSLPMAEFRPLAERVKYRVARVVDHIEPLAQAAILPLAPYTVRELQPAARRPPRRAPDSPPPASKPAIAPAPIEGWLQKLGKWFTPLFGWTEELSPKSDRSARSMPPPTLPEPVAPPAHVWEEHRRELEARFLSADLTDDERRSLWPELAGLYAALNHPADAAACWMHALWEDDADTARRARGWLAAEARSPHPETEFESWLTEPPTPTTVRAMAAFVVWAAAQDTLPPGAAALLAPVQRRLDAHEASLPVRAAWLSRLALNRLIGGDTVGLARCRDRLLDRLFEHGLSADLDVPSFLRFAGQVSGERRQEVREWLLRIREPVQRWITQPPPPGTQDLRLPQFGLGGAPRFNRAYADLILAWGLARLGERTSCQELTVAARRELPAGDPVHDFLADAYVFRAQQALEGKPHLGPLDSELLVRLAELDRRERDDPTRREVGLVYKIERLRQASRILEPEERIGAFEEAHFRRVPGIRGITNRDELADRLTEQLAVSYEQLPKALATALDLAPRIGESFAMTVLDRLLSVVDRWGFTGSPTQVQAEVAALERGWFVAAHFDRTDAARRLLGCLGRLLDARRNPADAQLSAEDALMSLVGQSLRGLRRLGLRADADRLLERLGNWVAPDAPDAPLAAQIRRRVNLAGGWFYVGRDVEAASALDDARLVLFSGRLHRPLDQTNVACAYVNALGQAPVRVALGRVEEVFQRLQNVHDQHSTNSHFSLARLRLVEAAVLAVVNDDFALGPAVRRWLDDDEFRVRQRIHREMRALTVEPG